MNFKTFIPNILTTGNLFCGIIAVYLAIKGHPFGAIHMIFIGMIIDFFDGKIARLTNSVTQLGAYLDSFSDIVSFGIAPAVLVYILCPAEYQSGIIFFIFLYAFCGLFRLIRYTFGNSSKKPGYFSGIPIPAAAGNMLSFLLIFLNSNMTFPYILVIAIIVMNALLMVSTLPYQHLSKIFTEISPWIKWLFIVTFCVFVVTGYYHIILFLFFLLYMILGVRWPYHVEVKVNS